MLGPAKPAGVINTDLSLPCVHLEKEMGIKELQEALTKTTMEGHQRPNGRWFFYD